MYIPIYIILAILVSPSVSLLVSVSSVYDRNYTIDRNCYLVLYAITMSAWEILKLIKLFNNCSRDNLPKPATFFSFSILICITTEMSI